MTDKPSEYRDIKDPFSKYKPATTELQLGLQRKVSQVRPGDRYSRIINLNVESKPEKRLNKQEIIICDSMLAPEKESVLEIAKQEVIEEEDRRISRNENLKRFMTSYDDLAINDYETLKKILRSESSPKVISEIHNAYFLKLRESILPNYQELFKRFKLPKQDSLRVNRFDDLESMRSDDGKDYQVKSHKSLDIDHRVNYIATGSEFPTPIPEYQHKVRDSEGNAEDYRVHFSEKQNVGYPQPNVNYRFYQPQVPPNQIIDPRQYAQGGDFSLKGYPAYDNQGYQDQQFQPNIIINNNVNFQTMQPLQEVPQFMQQSNAQFPTQMPSIKNPTYQMEPNQINFVNNPSELQQGYNIPIQITPEREIQNQDDQNYKISTQDFKVSTYQSYQDPDKVAVDRAEKYYSNAPQNTNVDPINDPNISVNLNQQQNELDYNRINPNYEEMQPQPIPPVVNKARFIEPVESKISRINKKASIINYPGQLGYNEKVNENYQNERMTFKQENMIPRGTTDEFPNYLNQDNKMISSQSEFYRQTAKSKFMDETNRMSKTMRGRDQTGIYGIYMKKGLRLSDYMMKKKIKARSQSLPKVEKEEPKKPKFDITNLKEKNSLSIKFSKLKNTQAIKNLNRVKRTLSVKLKEIQLPKINETLDETFTTVGTQVDNSRIVKIPEQRGGKIKFGKTPLNLRLAKKMKKEITMKYSEIMNNIGAEIIQNCWRRWYYVRKAIVSHIQKIVRGHQLRSKLRRMGKLYYRYKNKIIELENILIKKQKHIAFVNLCLAAGIAYDPYSMRCIVRIRRLIKRTFYLTDVKTKELDAAAPTLEVQLASQLDYEIAKTAVRRITAQPLHMTKERKESSMIRILQLIKIQRLFRKRFYQRKLRDRKPVAIPRMRAKPKKITKQTTSMDEVLKLIKVQRKFRSNLIKARMRKKPEIVIEEKFIQPEIKEEVKLRSVPRLGIEDFSKQYKSQINILPLRSAQKKYKKDLRERSLIPERTIHNICHSVSKSTIPDLNTFKILQDVYKTRTTELEKERLEALKRAEEKEEPEQITRNIPKLDRVDFTKEIKGDIDRRANSIADSMKNLRGRNKSIRDSIRTKSNIGEKSISKLSKPNLNSYANQIGHSLRSSRKSCNEKPVLISKTFTKLSTDADLIRTFNIVKTFLGVNARDKVVLTDNQPLTKSTRYAFEYNANPIQDKGRNYLRSKKTKFISKPVSVTSKIYKDIVPNNNMSLNKLGQALRSKLQDIRENEEIKNKVKLEKIQLFDRIPPCDYTKSIKKPNLEDEVSKIQHSLRSARRRPIAETAEEPIKSEPKVIEKLNALNFTKDYKKPSLEKEVSTIQHSLRSRRKPAPVVAEPQIEQKEPRSISKLSPVDFSKVYKADLSNKINRIRNGLNENNDYLNGLRGATQKITKPRALELRKQSYILNPIDVIQRNFLNLLLRRKRDSEDNTMNQLKDADDLEKFRKHLNFAQCYRFIFNLKGRNLKDIEDKLRNILDKLNRNQLRPRLRLWRFKNLASATHNSDEISEENIANCYGRQTKFSMTHLPKRPLESTRTSQVYFPNKNKSSYIHGLAPFLAKKLGDLKLKTNRISLGNLKDEIDRKKNAENLANVSDKNLNLNLKRQGLDSLRDLYLKHLSKRIFLNLVKKERVNDIDKDLKEAANRLRAINLVRKADNVMKDNMRAEGLRALAFKAHQKTESDLQKRLFERFYKGMHLHYLHTLEEFQKYNKDKETDIKKLQDLVKTSPDELLLQGEDLEYKKVYKDPIRNIYSYKWWEANKNPDDSFSTMNVSTSQSFLSRNKFKDLKNSESGASGFKPSYEYYLKGPRVYGDGSRLYQDDIELEDEKKLRERYLGVKGLDEEAKVISTDSKTDEPICEVKPLEVGAKFFRTQRNDPKLDREIRTKILSNLITLEEEIDM